MINISVVIPAHNEEAVICDLLDRLYSARRTPDEVVVVDANSSDSTADAVKSWQNKNSGKNVRLLELKTLAYPGRGRNEGVRSSSFSHIAFIDCGIIPGEDWLEMLAKAFEEDPLLDVAWGKSGAIADTHWERAFAVVVQPESEKTGSIASMCLKKEIFYKAGAFREDLRAGEDYLFAKSLKELGTRQKFVDAHAFYTGYPENFIKAAKKWMVYTEHSVYSKIYKKKLALVGIEIAIGAAAIAFGLLVAKSILFTIVSILVLLGLRVLERLRTSSIKIESATEFIYAMGIVASIDIGRMIGLFKGMIASTVKT